jgi:8-oxo-dGTP pyrophosphatase MutT (NUDIX family)
MKINGAHVVFHRLLRTSSASFVCAVLLYKRTQDAPMHPGYWGLVGGKLDDGEEPLAGALREVNEELGILASEVTLELICDVRIQRDTDSCEIGARYFAAPLNLGMDKLTLRYNSEEGKVEGEGLGWFTAEEIHHMWLRPEDRVAVEKFFERSGL